MKTPTLEEVKEHFKNAKEVRCLVDNQIYDISDLEIIMDYKCRAEVILKDLRYCRLYKYEKYAEIVSYKDTKPTHYPQGYDVIDFVKDKYVQTVINKFAHRSEVGFAKYGTNLERKDYSLLNWLEEAQQEAMDFVLYLEVAKNKIKENGIDI